MSSLPFICAIAALLCIIPTLIVYTILHSRDLELKRAIDSLNSFKNSYDVLEARTVEHREQIAKLNVKTESLDESFRAMNGKITSRTRWEDRKIKREEEAERKAEEEAGNVPVEQQLIPFPGVPVPGNGLPIQQQRRSRKFGEMP
jgi:sensor histidine kinase YesM